MIDKLLQRCHYKRWLIAGVLLLACGGFYSCTQFDQDIKFPSWLGNDVYDYLKDEGRYTNFVKLIDDLDYKEVLSKTGSKTLFVADDDAFKRFFAHNDWGVKSYSDFSLAQKKLLLNGAMINNAYQTTTLSSTEGPVEGDCMRRLTALSVYDSVPRINPQEMPSTPYWAKFKDRPEGIICMKDLTVSPMIHFLEVQMEKNRITNSDYDFLLNYTTVRQPGDASVNGVTIKKKDQKCLNGFIQDMSEVMLPLDNMAEIIRKKQTTTAYSQLLERFSAPYYSESATANYNRLYGTNVDSVYQKRYFSLRSQSDMPITTTPSGSPVPGQLKFDPGWNSFYSSTVTSVGNNIALQENMGVMMVPSNEALNRYWNNEGGRILKDYYGTWENLPINVLAKLINNNMQNSFISCVPSKFSTVLNDASNEMGLTPNDVDSVYLGCNGAVFLTNKVFSPTAYASVSFPALINDNMNIFYWAIEQLEYYAYLNSMDTYYSFFIPTNEALTRYIDPVSFGQTKTKLFKFYYDNKSTTTVGKVKASIWDYDLTTGTIGDSIQMASSTQVLDRLQDMLDYHTVIGNVEDGNIYYQTKGGGALKISQASQGEGHMQVSGGFQIEKGSPITVKKIYDESSSGNGKTYIMDDEPLMTGRNSVYDVLSEHEEFSAFRDLLYGSEYLETIHNKLYACVSKNISVFNTYHYTVYVPVNDSIKALNLPTWAAIDTVTDEKVKDSLTLIINNFLKYHIQDNSVYIGSGNISGNFETAIINPSTNQFRKLDVTANNSGIQIIDGAGRTAHVVNNPNICNLMAREYQLNTTDAATATSIVTSAYAVIHQIDRPLMYSSEQSVLLHTKVVKKKLAKKIK
jgi:uncharacterized surface protein with fasciclin (FAS1) repeats